MCSYGRNGRIVCVVAFQAKGITTDIWKAEVGEKETVVETFEERDNGYPLLPKISKSMSLEGRKSLLRNFMKAVQSE